MKRLCLSLLVIAACGDGPPAFPDANGFPDALFLEDAGIPPSIEIGTGVVSFIPLTEGQAVEIFRGPQGGGRTGGYHIWHAARIHGVDPHAADLIFKTLLPTGEEIASNARTENLQYMDGAYVVAGVAPALSDCCHAANADVVMRVEIRDRNGVTAQDQRLVHAGDCLLGAGGPSLCP